MWADTVSQRSGQRSDRGHSLSAWIRPAWISAWIRPPWISAWIQALDPLQQEMQRGAV